MAKFIWRLQRVLDVKKKQEQVKRLELLEITEQVAQARIQLMIQQETLRNRLEQVSHSEPQDRIRQQALAMTYAQGSQARIKALEEHIEMLHKKKQTKTDEMMALKRTAEGLERLRYQAKVRFLQDQEKAEQKTADELTLVKYARGLTESGLRVLSHE